VLAIRRSSVYLYARLSAQRFMYHPVLLVVLLVLAAAVVGCQGSDSSSPVSPSPVAPAAPQAAPLPTGTHIQAAGSVSDTAFRPLAGARVEAIDGPGAGASGNADAMGRFSLTGAFDDTTQFRATQEGHIAGTRTLAPRCATCGPVRALYFFLAVPLPPVSVAGDYTLTFAADSTCTDLPNEVRTRTYPATLTVASPPSIPANAWITVTLSGVSFLSHYDTFLIGIAGDYLAFNLEESEGPYLVEELAPNTYVAIGGLASATVGPGASTISTSFEGSIEYCQQSSPMVSFYRCAPAGARARCASNNHRLTLTRR
jgi:hypothetical protein